MVILKLHLIGIHWSLSVLALLKGDNFLFLLSIFRNHLVKSKNLYTAKQLYYTTQLWKRDKCVSEITKKCWIKFIRLYTIQNQFDLSSYSDNSKAMEDNLYS